MFLDLTSYVSGEPGPKGLISLVLGGIIHTLVKHLYWSISNHNSCSCPKFAFSQTGSWPVWVLPKMGGMWGGCGGGTLNLILVKLEFFALSVYAEKKTKKKTDFRYSTRLVCNAWIISSLSHQTGSNSMPYLNNCLTYCHQICLFGNKQWVIVPMASGFPTSLTHGASQ